MPYICDKQDVAAVSILYYNLFVSNIRGFEGEIYPYYLAHGRSTNGQRPTLSFPYYGAIYARLAYLALLPVSDLVNKAS